MYLEINTDEHKVYEQYLTFMNPFFNLTPNEVKVLAAVLYLYRESEGGKEEFRWGYIFSTEGKARIKNLAEMNSNQVNLTLSSMGKKTMLGEPLIVKEPYKRLHEKCVVDPVKNPVIHITFKIDGTETKVPKTQEIKANTETGRNNNTNREKVRTERRTSDPIMVAPVSQHEEEDSNLDKKGDGRYLSPEQFSRDYAIPVRKVYSEGEQN